MELNLVVMASLWPDSFDEEGNKTDWQYDPRLEVYFSPSTSDFMYFLPGDPPEEQQLRWIEEHKDAIRRPAG